MKGKGKKTKSLTKLQNKAFTHPDKVTRERFLLRKSNRMVEARYFMTLWEIRLFQELIEHINSTDDNEGFVFIHMRKFAEKFGQVAGNIFTVIREATIRLTHRSVVIEVESEGFIRGNNRLDILPLMQKVNVPKEAYPSGDTNSYVVLYLNPALRSEFLQLSQNYTAYNVEKTRKLSSTYAIRIYEIMARYRFIGQVTIQLEDLRELVGALAYDPYDGKQVKRNVSQGWSAIKKDILDRSRQQIEETTDIRFDFEPVYDRKPVTAGRLPVVAVRFFNIRYSPEAQKEYRRRGLDERPEPETVDTEYELVGSTGQAGDLPLGNLRGKPGENPAFPVRKAVSASPRGRKPKNATHPNQKTLFDMEASPTAYTLQQGQLLQLGIDLGISEMLLQQQIQHCSLEKFHNALLIIQEKLKDPKETPIQNVNGYFLSLLSQELLVNQYAVQQKKKEQELADQQRNETRQKQERERKNQISVLEQQIKKLEDQSLRQQNENDREKMAFLEELFKLHKSIHQVIYNRVLENPVARMVVMNLIRDGVEPEQCFTSWQAFFYYFEEIKSLYAHEPSVAELIQLDEHVRQLNAHIQSLKGELQVLQNSGS